MRLPPFTRSQIGYGSLVVVALALGQVIQSHLPQIDDSRPFAVAASDDGVHHLRYGDLEVTRISGSRTAVPGAGITSLQPEIRSDGVFVLVEYAWTGGEKNVLYTLEPIQAELTDAEGRVTTILSGYRTQLKCRTAPAGVLMRCWILIEAEPSTLPGSTLLIGRSPMEFDDAAKVDLEITRADVERWLDAEPVVLNEPEVPEQ